MISRMLAALRRLNPVGGGKSPLEPPESYGDERLREVETSLSEFNSPETFDRSPFIIHCGGCGEVHESYWSWYNHLGEAFDDLPTAQDWATVLVPDRYPESIEESVTEEPGIPVADNEGKPSPTFGNDDDSSKHGLTASELFEGVDGGNDEQ